MGGWTCQYDEKGFCKLLKLPCQPGMKGCTINKGAEVVFSTGSYAEDKERAEDNDREVDFSVLVRSN